jgi:hypothetical protein
MGKGGTFCPLDGLTVDDHEDYDGSDEGSAPYLERSSPAAFLLLANGEWNDA